MKIASVEQMRRLDEMTINETGIPGVVLMENAAREVFEVCKAYMGGDKDKKAVVVCGTGNNGGDGFAVARLLVNYGVDTRILLTGDPAKIKGDAFVNFQIAQRMGIEDFNEDSFDGYDLIVDAIFGTGFRGEPDRDMAQLIQMINNSGKYIVSVDIPSGVDGNTGHAVCAIKAHETVTFALAKLGNILYPGGEFCGKLTIADISIPQKNIDSLNLNIEYLTRAEAKAILPVRKNRSNKGTFGKVMAFAGSEEMVGAGVLSIKAAYKAGCGLVVANLPQSCRNTIHNLVPEAVFNTVRDNNGMFCEESLENLNDLNAAKSVILGPGIGQGESVARFVERILTRNKRPIVIDADALNAIAANRGLLNLVRGKDCIMTPHPGEMSRLTGFTIKEILSNPIETARNFAMENGVTVLLKDARTIIAAPSGEVAINLTGTSALAKGGSGDVLSGIIGGFMAQGLGAYQAGVLGAYVHGLSGELAGEALSQYSVLAGELVDFIPAAIKEILKA